MPCVFCAGHFTSYKERLMKKNIDDKLLAAIVRSGKKGLLFGELKKVARGKNITLDMVRNSIQRLCANGKTVYLKNRYYTPKALGIYPAKIVRNNRTFVLHSVYRMMPRFLFLANIAKGQCRMTLFW